MYEFWQKGQKCVGERFPPALPDAEQWTEQDDPKLSDLFKCCVSASIREFTVNAKYDYCCL